MPLSWQLQLRAAAMTKQWTEFVTKAPDNLVSSLVQSQRGPQRCSVVTLTDRVPPEVGQRSSAVLPNLFNPSLPGTARTTLPLVIDVAMKSLVCRNLLLQSHHVDQRGHGDLVQVNGNPESGSGRRSHLEVEHFCQDMCKILQSVFSSRKLCKNDDFA